MSTLDDYVLWNYMLAEHCLLSGSYEGTVLLTVTPRILAAALEEAGEGTHTPEDAEAKFVEAVGGVYRERVLGTPGALRALKAGDSVDAPFSIGFLAISVLAAYHMRTDEERTGRAYYPRLADMLGCGLTGAHPKGFEGEAFAELWEELAAWVEEHYGRRLASPGKGGFRKYVALPLAHVPLRQVDTERLPHFFDLYEYEPGSRPPLDRLAYDLYERAGPWRQFTEAGQQALADASRRPLVVRQVAHELERWDGSRTDSSGARIATIELLMDVRKRRAHLALLARRPQGFPEVIEDGDLVFESSQEGWYDPIPLGPDDGELLSAGIRVRGSDGQHTLQLRPSDAVPLTPADQHTGLVSDSVLRANARCAVLCVEAASEEVERFLAELLGSRISPRRDDTLPAGWCLFTDVRATRPAEPPAELDRLRVESSVALVPEGGLRLGRRWSWLQGAPARVTVVGAYDGLTVLIDGREAEISPGGALPTDPFLPPGERIIEVGNRLRRRVTVLPGAVSPECKSWNLSEASLEDLPLPLPGGHWTVLGVEPGECESVAAPAEGRLVRPPYNARWAVQVGTARGSTALHLHDTATPTATDGDRRRARRSAVAWAEALHQTSIRRPRIQCSWDCTSAVLVSEWKNLVKKARSVKRRLKRRHG